MSGWRRLETISCFAVTLLVCAGVSAARQFVAAGAVASTSLDNMAGVSASETLQSISSSQWRFEAIGRQFTEPIDTLSGLRNPADTHSPVLLPAVPAAISMTLCGFLCISFVRDRRSWLAMVAGVLWLGQTGIQAVPELTHRICSRITTSTSSPAGLDRPDIVFSSDKTTTGNAQSIRFVGLLRKLEGIPEYLSINSQSIQTAAGKTGRQLTFARKHSTPSPALALRDCRHNTLIVCPVTASGHFIVFSPAFIFQNLSRGPPFLSPESA